MKRWAVVLVVMAFPPAAWAQAGAAVTTHDIIHIDGSRHPELIPQWSAWGYAFRVIATGSRQLPSIVHHAVSNDEAALIMKEADALQAGDRVCKERLAKLSALLGQERPDTLDAKLRELTLACRRAILDARDRVLLAVNPAGARALVEFVDSTKSGTSLSIPKKDLARFLEPE